MSQVKLRMGTNRRQRDSNSDRDLIEYALVVALIALAATAGMTALASGINSAFTKISSVLGKYIS